MGHTRRLRFAGIMGLGLLATGGMGVSMAQNGLSANLALSDTIFTQQVGGLEGDGFSLFVDHEKNVTDDVAVSRLRIDDAKVSDMCMSAPISIPGLGDKKFQMLVAGDNTKATNLVIGAKDLAGSLTLMKPQIGVDAHQLSKDTTPGAGAIVAEGLQASDQTIHATSIAADKLTAAGGKISIVESEDSEC
ncbi:DUF6230 family protein [Corynebacterium suicordis]|uniref:Cholesterol esterase n=1 Tax=Corynebacterium suicordis DSM 45110 TaxID=1121369 RepID=A0ABR9ZI80_9CORY|nr:DUF6230 family protein [Corynebacterium suicordis]MBF4553065.1 hypothetical protein [Corynebacterium suicordis DSM 45110]MDR6277972.1 hypothetical protein [Corynebacterium suicordis]